MLVFAAAAFAAFRPRRSCLTQAEMSAGGMIIVDIFGHKALQGAGH